MMMTTAIRRYAVAYLQRGIIKSNLQDYRGALADYNMAMEINPKYEDAYAKRGLAKLIHEDRTGAIADLTKMIEINPKNATGYGLRAYAKRSTDKKRSY